MSRDDVELLTRLLVLVTGGLALTALLSELVARELGRAATVPVAALRWSGIALSGAFLLVVALRFTLLGT